MLIKCSVLLALAGVQLIDAAPTYSASSSKVTGRTSVYAYGSQLSSTSTATVTACAAVSNSVTAYLKQYDKTASKNAPLPSTFPIAIEDSARCLESIKLNKTITLEFLAGLSRYVQFQSTLSYLKNPPAGSEQKPIDVMAELQAIASDVEKGIITEEYDFETRVTEVVALTHDGHFAIPFNLFSLFTFRAPFGLLSISVDGTELPEIYVDSDLVAAYHKGATEVDSSKAVVAIDGVSAVEYINNLANTQQLRTADARYNNMFENANPGRLGAFGGLSFAPTKAALTITFKNGTTNEYPYLAYYNSASVQGLSSGRDYYEKVVLIQTSDQSVLTSTASATSVESATATGTMVETESATPTATEEPYVFNSPFEETEVEPFVQDEFGLLGGFFLNDSLNTAVLDIQSFETTGVGGAPQILAVQSTMEIFLEEARLRGSQKLIIDTRGNGGGIILLAYELYKQLFPKSVPYGATRARLTEALDQEIISFSKYTAAELDPLQTILRSPEINDPNFEASQALLDVYTAAQSDLDWHNQLDVNLQPINSLEQFTTNKRYGDSFTTLTRYNLSDLSQTNNVNITGYNTRAKYNDLPQPFLAEDIIFLTDGYCASTCTIFAEFLVKQEGVKTIMVGGLPNYEPTDPIGGVRGAQVIYFSSLLSNIAQIERTDNETATPEQLKIWEATFPEPLALNITPAGSTGGSINFRDNIREGDTTQTPLEFVITPADCRLFYSLTTAISSFQLWTRVVNLAFGPGTQKCAQGSLRS